MAEKTEACRGDQLASQQQHQDRKACLISECVKQSDDLWHHPDSLLCQPHRPWRAPSPPCHPEGPSQAPALLGRSWSPRSKGSESPWVCVWVQLGLGQDLRGPGCPTPPCRAVHTRNFTAFHGCQQGTQRPLQNLGAVVLFSPSPA